MAASARTGREDDAAWSAQFQAAGGTASTGLLEPQICTKMAMSAGPAGLLPKGATGATTGCWDAQYAGGGGTHATPPRQASDGDRARRVWAWRRGQCEPPGGRASGQRARERGVRTWGRRSSLFSRSGWLLARSFQAAP
eukprot:288694-Rhodomonas_salina.1